MRILPVQRHEPRGEGIAKRTLDGAHLHPLHHPGPSGGRVTRITEDEEILARKANSSPQAKRVRGNCYLGQGGPIRSGRDPSPVDKHRSAACDPEGGKHMVPRPTPVGTVVLEELAGRIVTALEIDPRELANFAVEGGFVQYDPTRRLERDLPLLLVRRPVELPETETAEQSEHRYRRRGRDKGRREPIAGRLQGRQRKTDPSPWGTGNADRRMRATLPAGKPAREQASVNFATTIIILIFIGILASLGSALIHLVRGRSSSNRAAKALTVRIGMSFALFVLLFLLWWAGLIRPHGI